MADKVKAFVEKVSGDEEIRAELSATLEGLEGMEQIPVIIAFAGKKGYEFSEKDFDDVNEDIDLNDLEAVTGGGGCGCAIYGKGQGDDLWCECIFGGGGNVQDPKHGGASQGICVCPFAGAGATRRH